MGLCRSGSGRIRLSRIHKEQIEDKEISECSEAASVQMAWGSVLAAVPGR